MNEQRATHLVHAPLEVVRHILLDPLALAEWNPALLTIGGPAEASTGIDYPVTTRGGFHGSFAYLLIEPVRLISRRRRTAPPAVRSSLHRPIIFTD